MKQEINLDRILKSYLTVEAMQANKPDYTYNMVITTMKHACNKVLDLAAENAELDYWNGDCQLCQSNSIKKDSILQIKDWIK